MNDILKGLLQVPKLKQALTRVENAFVKYIKAGGSVHPVDQRMTLAVNVKVNNLGRCAPEIREDKQEVWYETLQHEFWNGDLDCDEFAFEAGKHKWVYKDFQAGGRSNGWCCFMDEHAATAAEAYCAYTKHGSGFDLIGAVRVYNPNLDLHLQASSEEAINEIVETCNDLVDLFEPATETVKAVKDAMQYRIETYEGKRYYDLLNEIDNGNYEWFDLDNCVITIRKGIATASWPQYARTFLDRPETEPCKADDEGAMSYSDDGKSVYRRPTGEFKKHAITVELGHRDKLSNILNPNIEKALKLLKA